MKDALKVEPAFDAAFASVIVLEIGFVASTPVYDARNDRFTELPVPSIEYVFDPLAGVAL